MPELCNHTAVMENTGAAVPFSPVEDMQGLDYHVYFSCAPSCPVGYVQEVILCEFQLLCVYVIVHSLFISVLRMCHRRVALLLTAYIMEPLWSPISDIFKNI